MSGCERLLKLADSFAGVYSNSTGVVNVGQAARFVNGLRMEQRLLDEVAGKGGECPPPLPTNSTVELFRSGAADAAVELLEAVWQRVQTPSCYGQPDRRWQSPSAWEPAPAAEPAHEVNTPGQIWGYGLLFVTVINLCAVLGIVFLPCMGRRAYKLVMTFMVSLGVGTLVSSALLVLLPEALQLAFFYEEVNKPNSTLIHDHDHDHHHHHHDHPFGADVEAFHGPAGHGSWEDFLSAHPWYVWRACTAFAGIYGFFLLERALKELTQLKFGGPNGAKVSALGHGHSHTLQPAQQQQQQQQQQQEAESEKQQQNSAAEFGLPEEADAEKATETSPIVKAIGSVQPVAWMIIIGDSVHNFMDGLGIGAAFSQSTLSGVSISLAILCEELPHELGDFAILLSAGMSMKMALLFNFLSACFCYVGFALGVLLAETEGAAVWVFGAAAGMFLYIAMVDMLPEVNHSMEDADTVKLGKGRIFALQNLGLLVGFTAILLLALYGGNIKIG